MLCMSQTKEGWSTLLTRVAAGIAIGVVLIAFAASAWAILTLSSAPAPVPTKTVVPLDPVEQTAEDRANQVITKIIEERQPDPPKAAPKPQVAGAARKVERLPDTTLKLNCSRLRDAYSPEELKGMKEFQQLCL
ncbi:exported hypothetical protein [Novosphingobium sp. KN65.2]|nr:exported hypothetical protein [Novosphingobium sp. KN65.2]